VKFYILSDLTNNRCVNSGMLRSRNQRGLKTTSVDHFFGPGLTVIGFGLRLGLMKYWSRSHTLWSRGLKSILRSSSVA